MNHCNSPIRVALIAASWLVAAPLLHAQTPEQTPGQTPPDSMGPPASMQEDALPPSSSSASIADEKVDQFAAAFVAVQDIQARASKDLSTAKDDQQATEVKANAEKLMVEAVEKQGMQVEEFNRIADLMTTDLNLRSRVVEKVQARRKG